MDKFVVIQHNTPSWTYEIRNKLTKMYWEEPDVILLNGHGRKSPKNIKIYTYIRYTKVFNFVEETLAVETDTPL